MTNLYSVERGFLIFDQSITDFSSYTNVLFINKKLYILIIKNII